MSPLSEKSREIFEHISFGHSYDQILSMNPGYTYQDIFFAAREALALEKELDLQKAKKKSSWRRKSARSIENNNSQDESKSSTCRQGKPWDRWEDEQLIELYNKKVSVSVIAQMHYRTKGSISSRLIKLGINEN